MGFGVALQFITADHFVIAIKGAVLARFTVEDSTLILGCRPRRSRDHSHL